YRSKTVVIISATSIIVFLFSAMAAQWMGGAILIQSVTGMNYLPSLFIFTVTDLVYVIIGGFRSVVVTEAIQGIVMLAGTILLLIGVIIAGGGVANLFAQIMEINPNLITPYGADGNLTAAYVSSYWILVGVGVVALPQIAVRAMSYKDSRSMHRAIMIGTVVV